MTVIQALDEGEAYLVALMDDPAGIDLAEFAWTDDTPGRAHRRYRVWDYQWPWYQNESSYQIDQAGRSLGKSQGILMRACAFPFNFPGQEMLITAPELNHLGPIVDKVEDKFMTIRMFREMLPRHKGGGIKHQPQFQASFVNGARIMGRLPQRDGRGVKGSLGAGILVTTRRGQVPIEDVVVGDEVVTHLGRWKPVQHIVSYFNEDVIEVAGGGHRGMVMSRNHRMLARRNLNGPKQVRDLSQPQFIIPGDESDTRFYLGSPMRFEQEPTPDWATPEALWVAGRYVADGYLSFQMKSGTETRGRALIIGEAHEVGELRARILAARQSPSSVVVRANGTIQTGFCDTALARIWRDEFGQSAGGKHLPTWLLGASWQCQKAFLDGYLSGDGHWDQDKARWTFSSASKPLAIGLRLLGQSQGWQGSYSWVDPAVTEICGRTLKVKPQRAHRVTLSGSHCQAVMEQHQQWLRVRSIAAAKPQMVYDLSVKDDGSYLADGLISHNQHPLVLEADEMQDYPRQGWIELIETMKSGTPGAQWRCHGVSNGVRDMYYRMTNEDADVPFYVHRYMAMQRPTWCDQERREKIAIYGGSRDNPDYKRNIYGEHGDVSNRVFVLARLMACVRIQESTWATEYNERVYARIKIEGESLEGRPIQSMLQLPASHLNKAYANYWAGMDLGFTSDPSELLVFGQIRQRRNDQDIDVLRLLARIHLMRISAVDQESVIEEVFRFYGDRLRGLSLDKTGAGLPIWQHMDANRELRSRIKGYGFSEKRAVEFDDRALVGREVATDAMIEKNVIEFATQKLREYVDAGMMELPWDQELLTEFQGQTVVYTRDQTANRGSRTRYGSGSFHTLDAAKLMILGKELEAIEAAMAPKRRRGPILDGFLS